MEGASERFSAYYSLWGGHLSRGEPAPMREIAELFLRETFVYRPASQSYPNHRPLYLRSSDCCTFHLTLTKLPLQPFTREIR